MGWKSHLLLAYCRVTWDQGCCDHGQNGHFPFEPQIPSFWGEKRNGKEPGPRKHLGTVHSEGSFSVTTVKWLSFSR